MRVGKASAVIWLVSLASYTVAFQPASTGTIRLRHQHRGAVRQSDDVVPPLRASAPGDDVGTIQILMSDTGGGHRASANALRDAFNVLHETDPTRYPLTIKCDIVDIYTDYGPFPFNVYVQAYKIMAEYTFLWKWFYETGATPLGLWLYDLVLELICFGPFRECMNRVDPNNVASGGEGKRADMVVSVHPLCQDLPLKILTSLDTDGSSRSVGRTTPFVTVVTDLGGAHPSWFNKGVDKCFVPSDVLKNAALDRKVDKSKIVQYGLPIRRGFWRFGSDSDMPGSNGGKDAEKNERGKMGKPAMRERLGLSDLPTVLIVGGGDGMGGIVSQAKAVGERLQKLASSSASSYQMVVVCGNNKAAQSSLSPPQMQWGGDIDVRVQGFVNNMDEYMRASGTYIHADMHLSFLPLNVPSSTLLHILCLVIAFPAHLQTFSLRRLVLVPSRRLPYAACHASSPASYPDRRREMSHTSWITDSVAIKEVRRASPIPWRSGSHPRGSRGACWRGCRRARLSRRGRMRPWTSRRTWPKCYTRGKRS
jgi:1,2-diacylglycerol 3-beta-galactosyltransferase